MDELINAEVQISLDAQSGYASLVGIVKKTVDGFFVVDVENVIFYINTAYIKIIKILHKGKDRVLPK
jgi:hypothetical protein